jgi:ABC-type nitrate/sulfonate/bicarbonate transport system substrate-binding protein
VKPIARTLSAFALALASGAASAVQTLEVIVFPGGFNWPLWVGIERGLFAAEGLELKVTPTPNSVFLMQNLAAGKFDLAFATIDNLIAYNEGQGEAELPAPPEFFAFMGAQYGALRLVSRPEIRTIADLRGKTLAVDAATTGYAFVLRKLLQQGGLGESDYTFERLGGTAQRAAALMQGKTDATILTSPLELEPESRGHRRLANAVDALGPYQALVGMSRRSWARDHEEALVGFIRGYVKSLDWLSAPGNRPEAVAIYRRRLPQASDAEAGKVWDTMLGGREGFQKKAALDRAAIATVLELRSEFGRPQKKLDDPSRYIDESYYRKALSTEEKKK